MLHAPPEQLPVMGGVGRRGCDRWYFVTLRRRLKVSRRRPTDPVYRRYCDVTRARHSPRQQAGSAAASSTRRASLESKSGHPAPFITVWQ